MNLWVRVGLRVLARSLDFAWTGALTMFVVGAICGFCVGLCHMLCTAIIGKTELHLFGLLVPGALVGAFIGSIVYGVAGAATSRSRNAEKVINSINQWILQCGIVGSIGGYLNAFCFLVIRHIYTGSAILTSWSYLTLFAASSLGFFLLTFIGAIWGARKAMREMDKPSSTVI